MYIEPKETTTELETELETGERVSVNRLDDSLCHMYLKKWVYSFF